MGNGISVDQRAVALGHTSPTTAYGFGLVVDARRLDPWPGTVVPRAHRQRHARELYCGTWRRASFHTSPQTVQRQ